MESFTPHEILDLDENIVVFGLISTFYPKIPAKIQNFFTVNITMVLFTIMVI